VTRSENREALLARSAGVHSRTGRGSRVVLEDTRDLLVEHSLLTATRIPGYITSSAAPVGAIADFLAAAVNPNLGGWPLSPIATEIELQTVEWIAEFLGYPRGRGGSW